MKTFVINGSSFSDLEGFWDEIERVICPNFPFGRNMNALSDALVGGLSVGGIVYLEPAEIIWKNSAKSSADLGYEETVRVWKAVKTHTHESNWASIDTKIKAANTHEGPTLFDDIVSIIKEHGHQLTLH